MTNRRHVQVKSSLHQISQRIVLTQCGLDVDSLVASVSIAAPSLPLTLTLLVQHWHSSSIGFTVNNNDSTGTLAATLVVTGKNHFGESVVETVTVTAAAVAQGWAQTVHAYSWIDSIVLTAISGNAASDTLTAGSLTDQATAVPKLGIPAKIASSTEVKFFDAGNAPHHWSPTIALEPYYTATRTASGAGSGAHIVCVLLDEVL